MSNTIPCVYKLGFTDLKRRLLGALVGDGRAPGNNDPFYLINMTSYSSCTLLSWRRGVTGLLKREVASNTESGATAYHA